jgi:hypothetical protein
LEPGEVSWTIIVRPERLAPGLRLRDPVMIRAPGKDATAPMELYGPYRFLGLGERLVPFHSTSTVSRQEFIKVALAAPGSPSGAPPPAVAGLETLTRRIDEEKFAQALAIEHYREPPRQPDKP